MFDFSLQAIEFIEFYLPFLSSFCRNRAWMRAAGVIQGTSAQTYPHLLWDDGHPLSLATTQEDLKAKSSLDVGHNLKASI